MSDIVPITYATIDLRTERIAELHQCLMAHGFRLSWVEDAKRERWTLEDERTETNLES